LNFPYFIAKRYLLAKKSHNAINIISIISVIGISGATIAFIIILSVFNGFDKLIQSMFNSFYADIEIRASEGKVFQYDSLVNSIEKLPNIKSVSQILEDNALLKYDDKQAIAMIRGVDEKYKSVTQLDKKIYEGEYLLKDKSFNYALVGRGLKYNLGIGLKFASNIVIYAPKRKKKISITNKYSSLNPETVIPSGFFSTQPEIDEKYIIVPISVARSLFEYPNKISALEVRLINTEKTKNTIHTLKEKLGPHFQIKGRVEQNELIYKTMKSERWAIFFILTFILLVSSLNAIGTLTMLIIEKKQDIKILNELGTDISTIKRAFMIEGWFISIIGACAGLILGSLICLLQQEFGIVKLHGSGTFIIDAYPINLQLSDVALVFATVLIIGVFTTLYPIYLLPKKYAISN
jgi:lipoprotein-releasing system permease protein